MRRNDRTSYLSAKEAVKNFVVDVLEEKIGNIRDHIEGWDVATPATFIRYTGNWRGSIQGWMPSKDFLAAKPLRKELPGLKNFYMTGHWVEPGGAWIICSRDGKEFKTAK